MHPSTQAVKGPSVRIHRPTPSPHNSFHRQEQPMLAQSAFLGSSGWGPENYITTPLSQFHKRASSGSSITSAGPPSPLDHTPVHPFIATSDSSFYLPQNYEFDYMSGTPQSARTSKSLPTPTDNSTTSAFMPANYPPADAGFPPHMRRIQSTGGHDEDYGFSGQSVSSMSHNSPATPHTNYDVEYDDSKPYGENTTMGQKMDNYSLLGPGYTNAYQQSMHELFGGDQPYPTTTSYSQQSHPAAVRPNHLPARRSVLANRLQVANQDHISQRTNSPMTSVPRQQSPYRQDSSYMLQQQIIPQPLPPQHAESKSVSPKELMLEEAEFDDSADATPLFPPQPSNAYPRRREGTFQYTPNFSHEPTVQIPQQYPFVRSRSRQESTLQDMGGSTPDFPAHIASMESTVEEGLSEPASQHPIQRPEDTSSDSGTYSCTYHGCMQRFDSPMKLQKHKRDAHRQASPNSPAASSVPRNSQAGPHKCERTNPSTGKPCNSIFSRPYDLTRHEDTIHNNRKQKVRCPHCAEEKTFSRNDALTRHLRIVHPDFPESQIRPRRKNARD